MNTTLDFDQAWLAFLNRDRSQDGRFFIAVRTTGIYCRPSCPARRPKVENVRLFATRQEAEQAGYRPCLRCRPADDATPAEALVARARAIIEASESEPVGLSQLAETLSVSAGHLQRTFKRLTGLTPREYGQEQRLRNLKQALRRGEDVASATYSAGFGSSSRVYENSDALLGMTPGTYRRGGKGMTIIYSLADSPLGPLLVASTERGVCFVGFGKPIEALVGELRAEYPRAEVTGPSPEPDAWFEAVLDSLRGRARALDLPLDIEGSTFQLLVWQALRAIPRGETSSYGGIAKALGRPKAARAVARACATNPVALIVPCHRAVSSEGKIAGYRWGAERKKALLQSECEQAEPDP